MKAPRFCEGPQLELPICVGFEIGVPPVAPVTPAVMFPDLGGLPGDKFDVQYLPATIEDDCH